MPTANYFKVSKLPKCVPCHNYRTMQFSAKRGLAIACRLSVCLWCWWIV